MPYSCEESQQANGHISTKTAQRPRYALALVRLSVPVPATLATHCRVCQQETLLPAKGPKDKRLKPRGTYAPHTHTVALCGCPGCDCTRPYTLGVSYHVHQTGCNLIGSTAILRHRMATSAYHMLPLGQVRIGLPGVHPKMVRSAPEKPFCFIYRQSLAPLTQEEVLSTNAVKRSQ